MKTFKISLTGWGVIFIVAAAILSIGSYFVIPSYQQLSEIGGWIGGISAPLLNIAGFVMIYAAFRQQSDATAQTQLEFEVQRFDNTFFQLINLLHQNLSSIQQNYRHEVKGTHFFDAFEEHMRINMQKSAPDEREQRKRLYAAFNKANVSYIDHFVIHLIFTLQFISGKASLSALASKSRVEEGQEADPQQERMQYFGILRAQLAQDELWLLYHHTQFDPSGHAQQFHELLEKHAFFERIPEEKRF